MTEIDRINEAIRLHAENQVSEQRRKEEQELADERAIKFATAEFEKFLASPMRQAVQRLLVATKWEIVFTVKHRVVSQKKGKNKQHRDEVVETDRWVFDKEGLGHRYLGWDNAWGWREMSPEGMVRAAFTKGNEPVHPSRFMEHLHNSVNKIIEEVRKPRS